MTMRRVIPWAGLFLLGAACAGAERVPIEKFTQDTSFARASLSPDGRYVAAMQNVGNSDWLFIHDLEAKKSVRVNPGQARNGLRKEVSRFQWVSDRRISFLTTIWDGQAFTGMSAVDCDGGRWAAFVGPDVDPTDHRPLLATQIIHSFGDEDQSVLMLDRGSFEGADLVYPDVVRVSTLTGSHRTVVKNPGNVIGWAPDRNGVVRLGITRDGLRHGAIYRDSEQAPWRVMPLAAPDAGEIRPLGFDYSGQKFIVVADNAQQRRAVYYYDIEQGRLAETIASHEKFDIIPERGAPAIDGISLAGPVVSELAESVVGIRYLTEGPRIRWFDPVFTRLQEMLDRVLPNTVNLIVSRARDEQRFLVLAFSDRDPGTYYVVDLRGAKPQVSRLAERLAGFPVAAMATMYPIQYRARDGETIHGYLTLPPEAGKTGLPAVILPHGGPFVRDSWQFQPLVQFLASRGYAVLQMNFRGSPGYGTEFHLRGKREIGRGMQEDIEDGTRWLIAQQVADPARIAIVGASYGGYAALFALGRTPELYRCGVSISGVTDWTDIVKERRGEEYKYAYQHFREWIGDPKLAPEFLASVSPVNFADRITAPLLVVQGKADRTVPPKQARKLIAALKKAGRPPEEIFFAGEGHSIREEKNRTRLYGALEQFLAKHLAPGAPKPP